MPPERCQSGPGDPAPEPLPELTRELPAWVPAAHRQDLEAAGSGSYESLHAKMHRDPRMRPVWRRLHNSDRDPPPPWPEEFIGACWVSLLMACRAPFLLTADEVRRYQKATRQAAALLKTISSLPVEKTEHFGAARIPIGTLDSAGRPVMAGTGDMAIGLQVYIEQLQEVLRADREMKKAPIAPGANAADPLPLCFVRCLGRLYFVRFLGSYCYDSLASTTTVVFEREYTPEAVRDMLRRR